MNVVSILSIWSAYSCHPPLINLYGVKCVLPTHTFPPSLLSGDVLSIHGSQHGNLLLIDAEVLNQNEERHHY